MPEASEGGLHPLDRQHGIARQIRDQIIDGKLHSGDRLPVREELMQLHSTTPMTIHKVISRLAREGFVETRGRHGTFVAAALPHLHRYGLILQPHDDNPEVDFPFESALAEAAEELVDARPRRVSTYAAGPGYAGVHPLTDILEDLQNHRFAGLIAVDRYTLNQPDILRLLEASRLPIVSTVESPVVPWAHVIRLQVESFFQLAAERLLSLGRRRVGLVVLDQAADGHFELAQQVLRRNGLETRLWWRIDVNLRFRRSVRPGIAMMMKLPPAERPDSLIIVDDSLVPQTTAALVEVGAEQQLAVVAHANFPMVTPSAIKVDRLGFDAREVMRVALDQIDRIRNGDQIPSATTIMPRWGP